MSLSLACLDDAANIAIRVASANRLALAELLIGHALDTAESRIAGSGETLLGDLPAAAGTAHEAIAITLAGVFNTSVAAIAAAARSCVSRTRGATAGAKCQNSGQKNQSYVHVVPPKVLRTVARRLGDKFDKISWQRPANSASSVTLRGLRR